jgi:hypothetical protein
MTNDATTIAAQKQVMELIGGYCISQALYSAVELGLPDIVKDGPLPVETIAAACDCPAANVERLMRALCTVRVFARTANGYGPTPLCRQLQRDAPNSLAPTAMLHGKELYRMCSHLVHTVKSGSGGWEMEFGRSIWQYLDEHPDRGILFDSSMTTQHTEDIEPMLATITGEGSQTVVDLGGGNGSFLRRILERHASWRGVLFDRSDAIARARADSAWRELQDRCEFQAGDFFTEVPRAADQYLLRHILHDWKDADCRRILERCRAAMSRHGKLVIIEALMGTRASWGWAEWADVAMMLLGGAERSLDSYRTLLHQSGFSINDVRRAGPRVYVIEARLA